MDLRTQFSPEKVRPEGSPGQRQLFGESCVGRNSPALVPLPGSVTGCEQPRESIWRCLLTRLLIADQLLEGDRCDTLSCCVKDCHAESFTFQFLEHTTLRNPMDCSLPGSSIHGIFQARVLEWGAIAFSVMPEHNVTNIFRGRTHVKR